MRILDCTLRDGANVAGLGFDSALTEMMIEGLLSCGIREIEFGNAHGMGCNEPGAPLTDEEYLDLYQSYRGRGKFGMFLQASKVSETVARQAKEGGLDFLRVGSVAGKAASAAAALRIVKSHGLQCRYSVMRTYILTPDELAKEAKLLEDNGADELTLMDSAGTMMPSEVEESVRRVKAAVSIPVGFHGHNNLGLAAANALAAVRAGADSIDTGLMGMARSAGNCPTELAAALFQRLGESTEIDLYALLDLIDRKLAPAMEKYHYHAAVMPRDLILGLAGCHSNVAPRIVKAAERYGIQPYRLIMEVSAQDKVQPTEELIEKAAKKIEMQSK